MKRIPFALFFALGWMAPVMSQTASDPNEGARLSLGSGNSYSLSWWGKTGRTYFVQHSEDLMNWVYFPDIIDSGTNALLSYGFSISGPDRFYLRLKYTDISTANPNTADFDGDGVSNRDELMQGTDPLDYYNGILPDLQISIGNDQSGLPGEYLSLPLGVRIVNTVGAALPNAPVTFNVVAGGGHISTDRGVQALASNLTVRSNAEGYAFVYYQQSSNTGVASQIAATATSGSNVRTVAFAASTVLVLTPSNDNFANAQTISGAAGSLVGYNPGATKQTGEPDHADRPCSTSVWYKWVAPASGNARFDTNGSSFDTICAVYTGSSVAALTEVAANNDVQGTPEWTMTSRVTFRAVSGTTYLVAIDGFRGQTGKIVLNWRIGDGPANDYFANAQALIGDNGSIASNNVNATNEPNEPSHAGGLGRTSVWYSLQPATSGQITITTVGSDFDTLCAVYIGPNISNLTGVAANDDEIPDGITTSRITFEAVVGTTYWIAVDGYSGATGNIMLSWGAAIPPGNDNFGHAIALTGINGNSSGRNQNASKELNEPNHAGNTGGASVWYSWQAPSDGTFTFDTSGSTFDTVLAVYTGANLASLTEIVSNDDSGGVTSSVTFTAIAGTTYRIAVDGFGGATGDIAIYWNSGGTFAAPTASGMAAMALKHNGNVPPPALPSFPSNRDAMPGTLAALAAAEEECPEPAQPNRGEAGHWQWVDGQYVFTTARTILLGLPKTPTSSPCPVTVNIEHKIVTVNTPRARDLPGKLTLKLKSGDASIIEIKNNGSAYELGTPIPVLETGHVGCGVHDWHFGEEPFEFTGKTKGTVVLEAEVDPDPEDPEGDGEPTQKLTITINVIKITYTLDPLPSELGVSAKSRWPDQEAASRKQKITVTTDPAQFADRLVLKVSKFDSAFHPEYTPANNDKGRITQDDNDKKIWTYEAFEEAQTEKHPLEKKLTITATYDDVEICPPLSLSIRTVFAWLTEPHRHGSGGASHNPAVDADYVKAIAYAKWKYGLKLGNLRTIVFVRNLGSDGLTFTGGGVGKKDCKLGSTAFGGRTSSTHAENWCAATMIHENLHGSQSPPNFWYQMKASLHDKDKDYEVPAYQEQLDKADDVGLPQSDKDTIQNIINTINGGGTVP